MGGLLHRPYTQTNTHIHTHTHIHLPIQRGAGDPLTLSTPLRPRDSEPRTSCVYKKSFLPLRRQQLNPLIPSASPQSREESRRGGRGITVRSRHSGRSVDRQRERKQEGRKRKRLEKVKKKKKTKNCFVDFFWIKCAWWLSASCFFFWMHEHHCTDLPTYRLIDVGFSDVFWLHLLCNLQVSHIFRTLHPSILKIYAHC